MYTLILKKSDLGVAQWRSLPTLCKALGSIPSTRKIKVC